ncbi:hypothetical protein ABK040_007551 [Willaertia magna]
MKLQQQLIITFLIFQFLIIYFCNCQLWNFFPEHFSKAYIKFPSEESTEKNFNDNLNDNNVTNNNNNQSIIKEELYESHQVSLKQGEEWKFPLALEKVYFNETAENNGNGGNNNGNDKNGGFKVYSMFDVQAICKGSPCDFLVQQKHTGEIYLSVENIFNNLFINKEGGLQQQLSKEQQLKEEEMNNERKVVRKGPATFHTICEHTYKITDIHVSNVIEKKTFIVRALYGDTNVTIIVTKKIKPIEDPYAYFLLISVPILVLLLFYTVLCALILCYIKTKRKRRNHNNYNTNNNNNNNNSNEEISSLEASTENLNSLMDNNPMVMMINSNMTTNSDVTNASSGVTSNNNDANERTGLFYLDRFNQQQNNRQLGTRQYHYGSIQQV